MATIADATTTARASEDLRPPGARLPRQFDPAVFGERYYIENYKNAYEARNPRYKHRSYLRAVRRYVPAGRLLDVGCAFGSFLREAVDHFDATGIDISEHSAPIAARRVPKARVLRAAVEDLDVAERYDAIVSFDVMEHIPALDDVLVQLRGLLAPGGHLIIVVPVFDTLLGWGYRMLDHDPTHLHKTSRYDWLGRLERCGYKVVDWLGVFRYPFPGFYAHFISRSIRRVSPAILIAARDA